MAITLNGMAFEDDSVSVREKHEEVGGRDARSVTLAGIVTGLATAAEVEQRLDDILEAASEAGNGAALSLRPGRRLLVTRKAFSREVSEEGPMGTFTLALAASCPFEESEGETVLAWDVTASGAALPVAAGGNVFATPRVRLTAQGGLVRPCLSDGARCIVYEGVVADGETLDIDGPGGRVYLEGEDVTPYTAGLFPRLFPPTTTLTYTDDEESSHRAAATVSFRARWW